MCFAKVATKLIHKALFLRSHFVLVGYEVRRHMATWSTPEFQPLWSHGACGKSIGTMWFFRGITGSRRRLKIPVPKWWQASRNYKHFVYVNIYTLSAEVLVVLVGYFFRLQRYSLLRVVWCLISLIMISEFQGISWIPQNRSGNRVVCLILFSSKRHCEERSYGKVLHHGKWKAGIVVMVMCMFCIVLYNYFVFTTHKFHKMCSSKAFLFLLWFAFALYSTFKSLRQKLRKNLTLKVPPSVRFSPNTTDSQVARMCKLQSSLKDCQFEPQIWFDIDWYYVWYVLICIESMEIHGSESFSAAAIIEKNLLISTAPASHKPQPARYQTVTRRRTLETWKEV